MRQAEWSEFDFEAAVWRIPAARIKKRREHVVPLSPQSLAILTAARPLSGGGHYLFPALGKRDHCMSENTANVALRRMGFDQGEMTAHRLRVIGSGAVYLVDASDVTHSNVADAQSDTPLSIHDLRLHVLSAGDAFDLVTLRPEPA